MSEEQIIDEIEFFPTGPDGTKLPAIKAYTLRSVPGLCFHQLSFGNLPEAQAATWSISHIRSGAALGNLVWDEKEGGVDYILRYLSVTCWDVPLEILRKTNIGKLIAEADHDVKVRELIAETLSIDGHKLN